MSSFNELNVKTYTAGEALTAYTRVKKSGSTVVTAGLGATDTAIGVTIHNQDNGGLVTVRLFSSTGSAFARATGAITAGAAVYGAASGGISATASGNVIGYAEEAATASGDIIEVLLKGVIN